MHLSIFKTFMFAGALVAPVHGAVTPAKVHSTNAQLPEHVLYQFDNGTWVENLAVRSNNQLLVTLLTAPEVYLIDPAAATTTRNFTPTLIYSFANFTSVLGITEVGKDQFYVAVGTDDANSFVGSFTIWQIDMSCYSATSPAVVSKVADVPSAYLLNGLTTLDSENILAADALLGAVYRINVETGVSTVVIQALEMAPTTDAGIDGIKIRNGYLYFSNLATSIVYRVAINADATIKTNASIETVADVGDDDFTFDKDGNIWLAQNFQNAIGRLHRQANGNWTLSTLLGGDAAENKYAVLGPTAAEFGRTASAKNTLYVTTCGGQGKPVDGGYYEGGKVLAIDTKGWN